MLTRKPIMFWLTALLATASLAAVACAGGVPTADYDAVKDQLAAKETALAKAQSDSAAALAKAQADVAQVKKQLASVAPSTIAQVGQLQPVPAGARPTGWDTAESIRGGLQLLATYDSSGPDAWDPKAHPLVYYSSEGKSKAGSPGNTNLPGFHIIDAYTKEVVTSALFDLGNEVTFTPHGVMVSPDGRWVYLGLRDKTASGEFRGLTLIVNARTLKLDKVLLNPARPGEVYYRRLLHHIQSFKDWQGRDRVVLMYGFGAEGGTHFLLDPKDDNRVVRAIGIEDVGYKLGHPFTTPSPDGKFLYISLVAPAWREHTFETGGIAKFNLETGAVIVIPGTGDHPIGITHTADGKFTYVVDGHGSRVYKIDDETNKVVGNASAGVAGPYGIALNWDETLIYTVGKGEGSHNTGGVLGVIDAKTFAPARGFNQPIVLGGSASSVDHAILHPDPAVNELWVSNMNGWETIVLDLNTKKPKAYIPTPNGGDTHSGGFVRYNADWTGEVLADQGGPKSKTMWDAVKAKVAAAAAK